MFFDTYRELCLAAKKSPNGVAKELGFPSSSVTQWKKGSTPRPAALHKIAQYFSVPVEHLLSQHVAIENEQKNKPTTDGSELSRDILLNALEGTDDMSTLLAALDVINKKLQEKR